jgi:hypothetical protein
MRAIANQSNQQDQFLGSNEDRKKDRYRDLARDASRELLFWCIFVAGGILATRPTIKDFAALATLARLVVVFSFLFVALRSLVLMIYYAWLGGGLR